MLRKIQSVSAFVALGVVFIYGACAEPDKPASPVVPPPTVTPVALASPPAEATLSPARTTRNSDYLPITLPVLDAFFAEENFANELKTQLQLTDEQVRQLRTIARQETAKLRETGTAEYNGTTSAAREQAAERVRAVIGEEKAGRLADFVGSHWSRDSAPATAGGASAPGFNVVPADTRVVVNAPAYRMDVFRDRQLIKSYKIGIGYPEFPLPTGLRAASTIVFNPTWTPPDEPWVESPTSKVKVGEKVAAGSKLNPLGPIKIPIGLPSLIHGGKSPAKLGTFASHGCVGLTDAQVRDFARLLAELGGAKLTDEQIAEYAKKRTETQNVKLPNRVPVELRYETIVVEDGRLHIYRDVYDRDTNTEENLAAVLQTYGVSLNDLTEQERSQVAEALRQMSRGGKAGQPASTAVPATSPTPSPKSGARERTKTSRAGKNAKEVVIEIAALRGKGYPAPTDLDTGAAKKATTGAKRGG
ncbi:MAG TPA: L,D-transpeptidase [Blastocatellia bacterium]|nr:L,D-transpeptidase [Blastocatellia bacterium]